MRPYFRKTCWAVLAVAACASGISQAQVFKWVGPDGKTNYGDRPAAPPPQAQNKAMSDNVIPSNDLPFELAEARKKAPVTLYTGQKCVVCDEGRKLLTVRGVPFTEKTVVTNADIASFGGTQVELPQLTVGSAKLSGFDSTAWQSRLSAAGYPETNKLPKDYRNPPPTSAGPAETPKTSTENGDSAGKSGAVTQPPKPVRAKPAEPTIPGLRF